jgi:hypothetical protein
VIVEDPAARQLFAFEPLGYEVAVKLALKRTDSGQVKTTRSASTKKDRKGCNFWHILFSLFK